MTLEILFDTLLPDFKMRVDFLPLELLENLQKIDTPVNYFQFYNSVSSVYSSKIEGEKIDFDSFYKHKFLNVVYQPDYTQKPDDLYLAYEFIYKNRITIDNLKKVHSILSSNLLPKSQQGFVRPNPMFVFNNDDRIEYVAADAEKVNSELSKLFHDIQKLLNSNPDEYEIFYYASLIHLVFVKIHPFQDGNGRTARLLEKWFLIEKLGDKATAIQLEKNYYLNVHSYYSNIKTLGIDYEVLDYSKSLDFLLMTVNSLKSH